MPTRSADEGERHCSLDHLGSIRLITNPQRTIVGYHAYYPFGEEAETTWDGEVMKFTGHERDLHGTTVAMDDLDHMHARSYNPSLARFLTIDPGRDNDPSQPQSWNLYAYTRGNPMKYVDPTGRFIAVANERDRRVRRLLVRLASTPTGRAWLQQMANDPERVFAIGRQSLGGSKYGHVEPKQGTGGRGLAVVVDLGAISGGPMSGGSAHRDRSGFQTLAHESFHGSKISQGRPTEEIQGDDIPGADGLSPADRAALAASGEDRLSDDAAALLDQWLGDWRRVARSEEWENIWYRVADYFGSRGSE